MSRTALIAVLPLALTYACTFPDHTFDDAKFRALSTGGGSAAGEGSGGDSSEGGSGGSPGPGGMSGGGIGGDPGGGAGGVAEAGRGGSSPSTGGAAGNAGGGGASGDGGAAGTAGSGSSSGAAGAGGDAPGGMGGNGGDAGGQGGDAGSSGAAGNAGDGGTTSVGGSAGAGGDVGGGGTAGASGGGSGGGIGGGGAAGSTGGTSAGGGGQSGSAGSGGSAGTAGSSGAGGTGPTSPTVTAIDPPDLTIDVPGTTAITLTFSDTMLMSTFTGQTADGPCSGTVQVSCDSSGFVNCVGVASVVVNAEMVVITPAAALPSAQICETRVTTGATSDTGVALAAPYSAYGFAVVSATGGGCAMPEVVISQLYGGGGNVGSKWKNDFVELFNRSNHAVRVDGWSIQYTSAANTGWPSMTPISGTIQPGHYFLVQEAAGGMGTDPLPTPDAIGGVTMSSTTAKVALVRSTTAISGGCPSGGTVEDLVAYGTGSSCASVTSTLSNSTGTARKTGGCSDTGAAAADFASGPPAPRNSAVSVAVCSACN